MAELEVLEKGVEGHAVQGAPGAVEVAACLSLLSAVVVINELIQHELRRFWTGHSCRRGGRCNSGVYRPRVKGAVVAYLQEFRGV